MAEICQICKSDFQLLHDRMSANVGWPVIFSWNKEGEIWIGNAVREKPQAIILSDKSTGLRAMETISQFLLRQRECGNIQTGNKFYVSEDGIFRKKDDKQWGRFDFKPC